MALKKTVQLPSGYTAEYIRLRTFHVDLDKHEVSAVFKFYKDATTAQAGGHPATHQEMRLRASGNVFDDYLSKQAKVDAAKADKTLEIEAILYRMATEHPELTWCDFDTPDLKGRATPFVRDAANV
jgi:hypothetical protein